MLQPGERLPMVITVDADDQEQAVMTGVCPRHVLNRLNRPGMPSACNFNMHVGGLPLKTSRYGIHHPSCILFGETGTSLWKHEQYAEFTRHKGSWIEFSFDLPDNTLGQGQETVSTLKLRIKQPVCSDYDRFATWGDKGVLSIPADARAYGRRAALSSESHRCSRADGHDPELGAHIAPLSSTIVVSSR
jgi:hypothetical protein